MARLALGLTAIFVFLLAITMILADPFEGPAAPVTRAPTAEVTLGPSVTTTSAVANLTTTPGPPRAPELGPRTSRPSPGCGRPIVTGPAIWPVTVGRIERETRLFVPERYQPAIATPLVLNFHGSGRTALEQETYSGLADIAEREGFLLATPQGSGSPSGWEIPGVFNDQGGDDVEFAVALIDSLATSHCVDLNRVYATGMSNGAEMASLLACRRPDLIAAIAPVAGAIFDGCTAGAVSVMAFHGTFDTLVPFSGAAGDVASWARLVGCTAQIVVERVGTDVEVRSYLGCPEGVAVVLVVSEGGGHQWPGTLTPSGGVGPVSDEIGATELMWTFFRAHRLS